MPSDMTPDVAKLREMLARYKDGDLVYWRLADELFDGVAGRPPALPALLEAWEERADLRKHCRELAVDVLPTTNELKRVRCELRLFHERELEEECACDSCAALYRDEEESGMIEPTGGIDEE